MAKCPKCSNGSFRLEEIRIGNSNFRHQGVVCTMCECLVAVLPFLETNALIKKLAEKLGKNLD